MKYLTICAFLLPLVYGAAVHQPIAIAEAGKQAQVPQLAYVLSQISVISGGAPLSAPDMSVAADAVEADDANVDLIPDISVSADRLDDLKLLLPQVEALAKAIMVPDMSVAADANESNDNADIVPDISVAIDAVDDLGDDADLVPDIAIAEDAELSERRFPVLRDLKVGGTKALELKEEPLTDAEQIPDISVAADAVDDLGDDADLVPDSSLASESEDRLHKLTQFLRSKLH